jgi:hypothetical protein
LGELVVNTPVLSEQKMFIPESFSLLPLILVAGLFVLLPSELADPP